MPEFTGMALPVVYRCTIGADWVDFNGHLRDGYYMVLFSSAVDALMDLAGLDEAGRKAIGHSWFTLEAHVHYLHEVKQGAAVEVRLQLLGVAAYLQPLAAVHALMPRPAQIGRVMALPQPK